MKAVTLDGWLIVLLAVMPAVAATLGSDEAGKFIDPMALWISRSLCAVIGVGVGALKGYRSMQYALYKQNGGSGHTEVLINPSSTSK